MEGGDDMRHVDLTNFDSLSNYGSVFLHPIDEHYIEPSHIRLVRNIYGERTFGLNQVSKYVGNLIKIGNP